MTDKLKQCPFCGSPANWVDSPVPSLRYGIGCSNEKCNLWTGYGVKLFKTAREATKAWVRPASQDPLTIGHVLDVLHEMYRRDA